MVIFVDFDTKSFRDYLIDRWLTIALAAVAGCWLTRRSVNITWN